MNLGHALAAAPGPVDRLDRVVNGLREIVALETSALKNNQVVDLADFNARKSHGLLELTRALRARGQHALSDENQQNLRELREHLAVNEGLLKVHLEAVQEIADVMTTAINESESDGTYSASVQNVANFYV